MSYASLTDIYSRYSAGSLHTLVDTKIDNWGDLDEAELAIERGRLIQIALDDAAATIDGYIDSRATLPLKTVPQVLVRVACVLARFALEDGAATDKATKDSEDVLRLLEKVAAGDISLGLSKEAERPDGGDVAMMSSAGSVFSRDKSRGFI
ncbi:gp436 family protein [Yersinia intermedia]|uniref:gp436 family protein n=1 Tax=Yersinia intermedia TaxID=631 RepID=UPI0022FE80FA|nr:phage protein Gp36 family protein [Yersinia intermedia]MDA5514647.1 DUF1320 family protein [Yersinia intermedia]